MTVKDVRDLVDEVNKIIDVDDRVKAIRKLQHDVLYEIATFCAEDPEKVAELVLFDFEMGYYDDNSRCQRSHC